MVRARFAHERILQDLILFALHQLLQRGLVVKVARTAGGDIAEDQPVDDALCRIKAAVHVRGGDDRFHRVGDDGVALASAGSRLAVAQQQILAQTHGGRGPSQIVLADEVCTDARQLALRLIGVVAVEVVRHNKAQNRVAQKFQPLIVVQAAGAVFIGVGAVRQRAAQQVLIMKYVAQPGFQLTQHAPAPLVRSFCRCWPEYRR